MRRVWGVVGVLAVLAAFLWLAREGGFFGDAEDAARTAETDADAVPERESDAARLAAAEARPFPTDVSGEPVGSIDLRRGEGAVHGLVVGADGRPVPLARVVAVLPPPPSGAVRAGKDGTFSVRGLPLDAREVRVTAEGFLGRTVSLPALSAGVDVDLGSIALAPRPARNDGLEVKVVDGAGRPVAGARVTATSLPYGLHLGMPAEMHGVTGFEEREGTTDERGVARLEGLAPEKYDVIVRATGFAVEVTENVVVAQGRVERVTMKLSPGLSISGTLVRPDGGPAADGYLFALHQPSFRSYETVTSGADGSFVLQGLDPGSYWLIAGHEEHGMGSDRKAKAGDTNVRISLSGSGELTGRVVRHDGRPATSFVLRPYPAGQPFGYVYSHQIPVEDADGRFSTRLPPGNYQVDVKEKGGSFAAGPLVGIDAGGTRDVEIRLPVSGVVAGVVVGPDGNHVAGAEVYVNKGGFPPAPVRELYVRTDADGAFRLEGLALELVKLHVRHQAYAPTVVEATPSSAEEVRETTVRLSAGGRVEGRVLRKDDTPAPGEQVNLFKGFDFLNAKTTFTDADGKFAFLALAPDSFQVSTGRFENMAAGQQQSVTVPDGGVARVEFRLESSGAGTVSVSGKVTQGGEPVSGASVFVIDGRGFEAGVTVTTDAQGRYEAPGLEPGSLRVTATVGTSDTYSITRSVSVAEGQSGTLDLEFGTQRIRGRVVEEDGRTPLSAADVSVEAADAASEAGGWSAVRAWVNTDREGVFQAAGLQPGRYRLRVSHLGRASITTDPLVLAEGEVKDVGAIRLPVGASVRGRVTDSEGRPVEAAGITLRDAAGKDVFLFSLFSTGSDGRYEVQGLALGSYTVRFDAKGYAPVEVPATLRADGAVVDAVLSKGGAVEVTVEDATGRPVPGARIEIRDAEGRLVARTLTIVNLFEADVMRTGAEGRTTIPDLPPGTYSFGANAAGMVLATDPPPTASVASGRTTSVRLALRAK
jgi:protocatechuate 3,4-dioxygenase beta subunit